MEQTTIETLRSIFPALSEKEILDCVERGLEESLDEMEQRLIKAVDEKIMSFGPSRVDITVSDQHEILDIPAELVSLRLRK